MTVLLHPTYFPNVAQMIAMLKADAIVFEVHDNYQKQTFRNRTSIYAANGQLDLIIPVNYTQKNRQLYREVKISNIDNWQDLHFKSLESAYRMSPFYEFYIDELKPLFESPVESLMDFNLKCLESILNCLEEPFEYETTVAYEKSPENIRDARALVNRRKGIEQNLSPYDQVFESKYGFLQNLSILDLLFNEGPNATLYLRAQSLNL